MDTKDYEKLRFLLDVLKEIIMNRISSYMYTTQNHKYTISNIDILKIENEFISIYVHTKHSRQLEIPIEYLFCDDEIFKQQMAELKDKTDLQKLVEEKENRAKLMAQYLELKEILEL